MGWVAAFIMRFLSLGAAAVCVNVLLLLCLVLINGYLQTHGNNRNSSVHT